MIRFILIILFLVLFLVLGIPLLVAEWVIGKFNPGAKDRIARTVVSWGFGCIRRLAGVNLIVRGRERIPQDGAVLYVGNHRSYFDIVLSYSLFLSVTGYVAKYEMIRWPLLNLWMKNVHCLFLDRNNIKQGLKTILKGVEEVKRGVSICIFPEGTRNKVNDTFLPFHEGSFKIAEKGGVPIVPMVILNAAGIFEDHLPRVRKATVVIEFEDPIYVDRLDKETRKRLGDYVSGLISDRYFELKREYSMEG